jgi:hypothetical protein
MLTIRKEQMAVFEAAEMNKFVEHMLVHLNKVFPNQCQALGEAKMRETIQHGIKRAAAYGITAERDVCKYIDLMIVFGRDFDVAPECAWAGEILNDKGLRNPTKKMDRLFEAAKQHARS